jgi:Zn-dependent peptidase ImmA (M78 family)
MASLNAAENHYLTRWPKHVALAHDALGALPKLAAPMCQISAFSIRKSILDKGYRFVELPSLLDALNGHGIPVLRAQCPSDGPLIGLAVTQGGRAAIVLSDSHTSPSRMACDLAHLAGHVFLGHLGRDDVMVDVTIDWTNRAARAEHEANEFALTLLTGKPTISFNAKFFRDYALVDWAHRHSAKYQIAPAIVVQLFGRQMGKIPLANRACKAIENAPIDQ